MPSKINWDDVAETVGTKLFAYFSRRGAGLLASDLTQETLLRLYDKVGAGQLNPELGSLVQYSFGIARLVWLESAREHKEFVDIATQDIPLDGIPLSEQVQTQQTQKKLRSAIGELSDIQQEVLCLILDQDLGTKEISTILEQPEGTVKSHLFRAKESLKEKLQEYWEHL